MAYGSKVANAKTRISSIDNKNNGGSKKAGFPYMVGRGYMTSVFFRTGVGCGGLACFMKNRYENVSPTAGLRFTSSMGVDHR
jgi:hypothetical protein